VDKKFLPEHSS